MNFNNTVGPWNYILLLYILQCIHVTIILEDCDVIIMLGYYYYPVNKILMKAGNTNIHDSLNLLVWE